MFELLDKKERLVILRLAEGMCIRQVAADLHCASSTVKGRLKSVRQKLGARTTVHAVALIFRDAVRRMGGVG